MDLLNASNYYVALFKICICSDSSTSPSTTLLSPGTQTTSWEGTALFRNTFPVSAIPCPFNLHSGEVHAGTLWMSEQAVHQHAHAALLYWHASCRHFLASSSCLSLNLLGIVKEHTSVFAYIESLDDIDLCYLSLPGPIQEQRRFFLLYRGTCFCLLQPFLNGEWRASECECACVCEQALQIPS